MSEQSMDQTSLHRRQALASRLWRAAELQAAEIEARVALGTRPPADCERDARVLSVLAKTLKELAAADAAMAENEAEDDDATPDDLDSLRDALTSRLERIVAERNGAKHN